jgi:predicted glutamine amidotransferase
MCELLGMSFSAPVSARVTLDIFQRRGEANPDGWGLAFYRDGQLHIIKESEPAPASSLYDFVEKHQQSEIFISHVRRSTMGGRSYLNTHPFYRAVSLGGPRLEYSFAHNGTLRNLDRLNLKEHRPLGETDSECAFCFILEKLIERGIKEWNDSAYLYLERILHDLNDRENTLNCMMSDGVRLMCYSDENNHNDGLRMARQISPFGTTPLVYDQAQLGQIDIESQSIGGSAMEEETGCVVVTKALTSDDWTEFEPGELIVIERGQVVFPETRRGSSSS